MSNELELQLRAKVKSLLEEGKIKFFIGYERGSDGFRATPAFIHKPEDVDRLIVDSTCSNNLTIYLLEDKKKVLPRGTELDKTPIGILSKGCDTRSIIQLIAEHKLDPSEIFVIGLPGRGVIDPKKMEVLATKMKIPSKAIANMTVTEVDDDFIGEYEGQKWTFPRDDVLMDKCKVCVYPNPLYYDDLLRPEFEVTCTLDYSDVEAIEAMSIEERWAFWSAMFSKCIRCYACRDICPECYCEECVVDPTTIKLTPKTSSRDKNNKSLWIERSNELPETIFYHLTRMMHMMGRCTNCGECTRVCPVDIPLNLLTSMLEKEAKELFDHVTGIDKEGKPLLAIIDGGDPDDFVK